MVAKDYAEQFGWKVFPCIAGEKIPATAHGFKDAVSDPELVDGLFSDEHNVGIATGDGLFVLDVDRKPGRPDGAESLRLLMERHEPLPVTAKSLTPNNGQHYYFRAPRPVPCSTSKIGPSLDIKCDGGYVIAPPSVADGAAYRWAPGCSVDEVGIAQAPEWLLELAGKREEKKPAAAHEPGRVVEGARNEYLTSQAGSMRHRGMSLPAIKAGLHAENMAVCKPPLPADEVDKIAEGIMRYAPADALRFTPPEELPEPETHDPGDLPAELFDVPGFVGEVIAWNLRTAHRKQPGLALGGALALLSALTGRKVCDARNTRTNAYIIGIGQSGYGKDHARVINQTVLVQSKNDELIGPEDFASSSGLVNSLAHRGCQLFQVDEIGRVLKSINNPRAGSHQSGIITELLRLYSSAGGMYLGKAFADRKQNARIIQPHAVLYGTTTPENFYAGLTPEGLVDGFYGRLLAFTGKKQGKELDAEPIHATPDPIMEAAEFWREFKPGGNLSSEHPQPAVVEYSEGGRAAMREFSDKCEALFMEGNAEGGSAIWGRAAEKASKLALLYACSECPTSPEITSNASRWAAGVIDHQTNWMLHEAAQYVSENETEASAKRVKRIIEASGTKGLTKSELTRKTQWLKTRDRNEILGGLIESGFVVEGERKTTTRPASVFIEANHSMKLLGSV